MDNFPNTVHKGELEKQSILSWGYEGESVGRVCRMLEKAGKIQVILNDKHHATYKYIPRSDNPIAQKFLEDFGPFKGKELQEQLDKLTLF